MWRFFGKRIRRKSELNMETLRRVQAVEWERTPRVDIPVTYGWRAWHHERFGGSPIPICLKPTEPFSHNRLFLGPSQVELGDVERPQVDSIVNLCELDDAWDLCEDDRRLPRGEGAFGYTWQQLYEDTNDTAELIHAGKRVLVHCMAGVNRSTTLVCATLMRVEGITARDALMRVYRFHPRAHPEDRHWLVLRQIDIVFSDEARGIAPVG